MKRLISSLTIAVFLLSGSAFAIGNIRVLPGRVTHYTTEKGGEVRHYQIPKVTVIKPATFDILFDGLGDTATNVVREHQYSAAINASYFGWHDDGTYFPAGVWYNNWFLITPQKLDQKDINLQVLAYYNKWKLELYDNSSVDLSTISQTTPGTYFNAGPWLVKQWKINPDIVKSRSHWQSKTYRTAVLRTATGNVYFLVATAKIDLPQFIVFAYKSNLVAQGEKFDLVNLDGGSSTSLWTPGLKFNSKKTLPLFIGIK